MTPNVAFWFGALAVWLPYAAIQLGRCHGIWSAFQDEEADRIEREARIRRFRAAYQIHDPE